MDFVLLTRGILIFTCGFFEENASKQIRVRENDVRVGQNKYFMLLVVGDGGGVSGACYARQGPSGARGGYGTRSCHVRRRDEQRQRVHGHHPTPLPGGKEKD